MEPDEGAEEEGPFMPLLPPDDRLWRHPSEMHLAAGSRDSGQGDYSAPSGSSVLVSEHSGMRRIWAIALVAGVVGALTASGVGMVTGVFEQRTTVVRSVTPQAPELTLASDSAGTTSPTDWTAVDDSLAPSIVAVTVDSPSGPATGSGMMFLQGSSNSYIVTDNSLVSSGGSVTVSYLSGETVRGHLVGSDPLSGIALLSVPNRQGPFPVLGSVSDLRVANPVLAIGARTSAGGSVF
ncbi:MAG TPA: S1C family serine protease, partial [Acidimicrobiales bacterium]|nr:S1C family serine protease [Acidimicrobiales bacterium]